MILNRKRTADEIETVASDDTLIQSNSAKTSKVPRQDKMEEDQLELRAESSELLEHHKEADTIVESSIPTTAAESSKVK